MERPDFELDDLMFEDDGDRVTFSGLESLFIDGEKKSKKPPKPPKNNEKGRRKAPEKERPAEDENYKPSLQENVQKKEVMPSQEQRPEPKNYEMEEKPQLRTEPEIPHSEPIREKEEEATNNEAAFSDLGIASPSKAKTRVRGKITRRVDENSIKPFINRKVDAIIEHMLTTGDIQIGKEATRPQPVISNSTMPLHAAAAGPITYCLVDTATNQMIQLQGILRIGRDASFADLIPAGNTTISSQHAQITEKGGIVLVRDLDSRNGTFINNERIARGHNIELNVGDIVKFSNAEYRLETI